VSRLGYLRVCGSLVAIAGLSGCTGAQQPLSDPHDVIVLRWVAAYPGESRSDVETGLLWGLSLLGANLPADAEVLSWRGDKVTVDLARAQVLEQSSTAWRELIAEMKRSGEYRKHGAIDIGRFLALTLGDSDRYYALTAAQRSYAAARQRYRFDARPAAIVKSAVAYGNRVVDISIAERADQVAFVAFEGDGVVADGTFVAREMELVDMMPNGQLRFAMYDPDGRLKQAASERLSAAGKPAKCMWCHESGLQSTFVAYAGVRGFHDRAQFDAAIAAHRALLLNYRDRLHAQIRFRNLQDHTFAELLYLSFEEPSLARLSREWGVSVERAGELLRGKSTHAQAEFDYLGKSLYRRQDVDALAPYQVLAAPPDARESSGPGTNLVAGHGR
jgi:hypothetical protein